VRPNPLLVVSVALATSAVGCALLRGAAATPGAVGQAAADQSPAPDSFSLVVLHPAQGDISTQLAAHAQLAAEMDRRPYVEFSAEWCPSCVALQNSLTDELMVEAFHGVYLIRLDFDEWKGRLSDTGLTVVGVPAFFELDSKGTPTGRAITGAAWGEDIPENMAPALKDFFEGNS